jgi:hypothetical protein
MAGSLDLSRGLRITLILNLVLAGFYYAFAGEDAAAVSGTVLGFSTLFTLIAHCGLPFAEAAFVSLFIRKKDYRSVLYVRMVSGMFAIGITVFVCIVLALCAGPLKYRLDLRNVCIVCSDKKRGVSNHQKSACGRKLCNKKSLSVKLGRRSDAIVIIDYRKYKLHTKSSKY